MTLPKILTLASKNFNNFKTIPFESSATTNIPSQQQQSAQDSHQPQNFHSTNAQHPTMSSLPLIQNTSNLETNTMLDDAGATTLPPLQLIHLVECVMPGIYLTKDFISWKQELLRAHGFTHIIIIDKHIQELYYPNQQPDIFKLCSINNEKTKRLITHQHHHHHGSARRDDSSSIDAFDYYCPTVTATAKHLNFGKEFEVIDLNFGEKSYLTTVLPNCYRAVKFINRALQSGGSILVIDCNGGEQKCLTIIVAYLMYKNNISFSNAFARLKEFYKKADLDRFYISQLYEYEPILQVQRAQSRGHSCSRELHAAILKRKKTHDDDDQTVDNNTCTSSISLSTQSCYYNTTTAYTNSAATELLNNCNPLNRFDTTQMERQDSKITHDNRHHHTFTRFMSGTTTGGWYNWDDYVME